MTTIEWDELWNALEWDENRAKMQLQLFVTYPELFNAQGKEWLNDQINVRLDYLREIKRRKKLLLRIKPKDKQ